MDIPLEVIDECVLESEGKIYFWFEGEAFASAPVGAE